MCSGWGAAMAPAGSSGATSSSAVPRDQGCCVLRDFIPRGCVESKKKKHHGVSAGGSRGQGSGQRAFCPQHPCGTRVLPPALGAVWGPKKAELSPQEQLSLPCTGKRLGEGEWGCAVGNMGCGTPTEDRDQAQRSPSAAACVIHGCTLVTEGKKMPLNFSSGVSSRQNRLYFRIFAQHHSCVSKELGFLKKAETYKRAQGRQAPACWMEDPCHDHCQSVGLKGGQTARDRGGS